MGREIGISGGLPDSEGKGLTGAVHAVDSVQAGAVVEDHGPAFFDQLHRLASVKVADLQAAPRAGGRDQAVEDEGRWHAIRVVRHAIYLLVRVCTVVDGGLRLIGKDVELQG